MPNLKLFAQSDVDQQHYNRFEGRSTNGTQQPPRLPGEFQRELAQFTGTEEYRRHNLGGMYTDGVAYLASGSEGVLYDGWHKSGGAFWLLDAIFSWQREVKRKAVDRGAFQVWHLFIRRDGEKRGALLVCHVDTCTLDEADHVRCGATARQEIEFTDFPLDEIKLYLCDGVLLLPSEY